jgi:hypothetical protein
VAWRLALGVTLAVRTPAPSMLQHSHVPPPQRSSHRAKQRLQSSTDWLPDDASFASRIASVGNWLAAGGAAGRTKSDRVTEMSQSDAWPSDYTIVDTPSRYKQQFTASVKLHTSPATRATWDDLSANVPLQTIWPLP